MAINITACRTAHPFELPQDEERHRYRNKPKSLGTKHHISNRARNRLRALAELEAADEKVLTRSSWYVS